MKNKKIGNAVRAKKSHSYSQDYTLCASLAYHWRKLRPDSDEIKALCLALVDMHKYTQSLESDIQALEDLLDEDNQ